MSVTRGAPESFRGEVIAANHNYVHIRALKGGHEAIITRPNVLEDYRHPCVIGGQGTVKRQDENWIWAPDHGNA